MSKKIFATYNNLVDIKPQFSTKNIYGKLQLNWINITDELGNKLNITSLTSNPAKIFKKCTMGDRYLIECRDIVNGRILYPSKVIKVNKNLRCSIIRKTGNTYIFIKGKYKGKKITDIDEYELNKYLIYLGKTTYNETTIKNVLDILNIIN